MTGAAPTLVRFRIRAYADDDYRAQHIHWKEQIERQIRRASDVLEVDFNVRFEVESVRSWSHSDASGELRKSLTALAELDPGVGVDRVVGFVSVISTLPSTLEQLGIAAQPGRHFILRGMESAEELVQLREGLNLLPQDELESLLEQRHQHRETLVFLHEWAHTLGLSHDSGDGWILSPRYDLFCGRFSDGSTGQLRDALAQAGKSPEKAPAAAGQMTEAAKAAPSRPASETALDEVLEVYKRKGNLEQTWKSLVPLAASHPDDARIQYWTCYLAYRRKTAAAETEATCERAARLTPEAPDAHIILGHVRLMRKDKRGALRALADAESVLSKSSRPDAEAWEFLAEIYAHAGNCSGAERAAARVPRNQVAHDAAEWCKKRK
jgi:tetratricopeptide (TPR) repeat protein